MYFKFEQNANNVPTFMRTYKVASTNVVADSRTKSAAPSQAAIKAFYTYVCIILSTNVYSYVCVCVCNSYLAAVCDI